MTVTQAENSVLPNAPAYKQSGLRSESETLERLDDYAHKLSQWAGDLVTWQMDLQGAIERGWLINNARVISLEAGKITAGTISVGLGLGSSITLDGSLERITVGSSNNIIIDGLNDHIAIYDDAGQLRGLWGQQAASPNILYFNGTSTSVNCGNPSAMTENIFAMECQFKLETLPSAEGHDYHILYKNGKFILMVHASDNKLKLWDFSASALRDTGVVMQTGRWYHVLIFFYMGTTNGEVWLDGELVLDNFSYNDTSDAGNLHIGSDNSTTWFKGWVREVRYWGCDTGLTAMLASEVKSLDVQTLPATVRPTNLVTFRHEWQLDEGTGTSANDTGDTGGQTGTINNGTWQTLADNWGLRMVDKNGEVFFYVSDKVYINGAALINRSVGDAAILDVDYAKINNVSIGTADIQNLAVTNAKINDLNAGKINTGILNAAVVSVINLSATNISTGTLTADGSPVSISVTGAGALLFSSGGDIVMRANATDFNYIYWQTTAGTQKGTIGLGSSGAYLTLASSNSAGIWLDTDNELLFTTNTSNGNIYIRGRTRLADNTNSWVAMPNRTTAPSSPIAGTFYFDASADTLWIYNGTAWKSEVLT